MAYIGEERVMSANESSRLQTDLCGVMVKVLATRELDLLLTW